MAWKAIDPQPVRALFDGTTVETTADRWDDFTGAIGCAASDPGGTRVTILAGEYTPLDESSFEDACTAGTRI